MLLLLTGRFCRAQAPSPDRYRAADDLSGWIYEQLQWVAKDPAARSQLLTEAVANAWRRPRTDAENQAWLDLLTNEGYALLLKGAIVPSTDAYTAAYNWARQHREIADEQQVLETILKPLGNNYTRLGDYEQALFIHRKALAIAITGADKQALAGVYANLANTSSNMGRPRQSLDYCGQGLAVVNGRSALAGLLLSERADAAMQLGDMPFARESITKSVKILEDARRDPSAVYWLLMAYQQAGDIYTGEPANALEYYKKAYALQNTMSSGVRQRERAKLLLRLGSFYLRTGRPDQAEVWLDKCLGLLLPGESWNSLKEQDLYAENTLADLLFTRAGLARHHNDDDGALRLYTLSFAASGRLRHQLISVSSREEAVNDTRKRYEEAIGLAWDAWAASHENKYLATMLRLMEGSRAQLLLEERQQQYRAQLAGDRDSLKMRIRLLQKALSYYQKEAIGRNDSVIAGQQKQLSWELAQLYRKAPVMDTVADGPSYDPEPYRALRKGQTARSFFCGSSAIYTLECTPAGISFAERLPLNSLWQDSLKMWIHVWFGEGEGEMINHPFTWYRQAYRLYQQLFALHPLQPGTNYILLTDGALSLLPIDALVTSPEPGPSPAEWQFVIRQAQVSYGWSLRTLKELTHSEGGKGFSGLLISGSYRSMPTLKAIAAERQGLQRLIPDGVWYSDAQATTAS
ncbi:MAG: CHAT domain-containing protein, partial [Bacteroidetes bacterium]|nr:CHAT domain-containing protein [Bacteroidota bacterium]